MIYLTIAVVVLLLANIILFTLWQMEIRFGRMLFKRLRCTELERAVYEGVIDAMFSDEESKKQIKELKARLGEAFK